jgi:hypothetical protein
VKHRVSSIGWPATPTAVKVNAIGKVEKTTESPVRCRGLFQNRGARPLPVGDADTTDGVCVPNVGELPPKGSRHVAQGCPLCGQPWV